MSDLLKKLVARLLGDKGFFLFPFFQLDTKVFPTIFYLKRMYEKIDGVEGDVVECGIGYSRTFQILCLLVNMEKKNRNVWGFDSFEGFPEPTAEDLSKRNPKKGEWKVMTVEQLYKILEIIRLPREFITRKVTIVKGYFENTLPTSAPKIAHIALLHLDVDLYQSYKTCLEHLYSKVVPGGLVLFDEYGSTESYPGAKKAIDEFFEGKNQTISKDDVSGKYYLIKK